MKAIVAHEYGPVEKLDYADWPEPEFLPGVLDALNQRLQILLDELDAKPNLTSDFQQSMLEKFEAYQDQLASPENIEDILNAYKDGLGLRQPTFPLATGGTPGPASATVPTLATVQAGPTGIPFVDDLISNFFADLKPLEDIYKSAEATFNLQVGTMPALVKWSRSRSPSLQRIVGPGTWPL